jgi:hypothetical protein
MQIAKRPNGAGVLERPAMEALIRSRVMRYLPALWVVSKYPMTKALIRLAEAELHLLVWSAALQREPAPDLKRLARA